MKIIRRTVASYFDFWREYKMEPNGQIKAIGNTRLLHFCITFYWSGKQTTISLEKGEDVFLLAKAYKNFLIENQIKFIEDVRDDSQNSE